MVGAYIMARNCQFPLPPAIAIALAIITCTVLNVVIGVAYTTSQVASPVLLITAIGISLPLENLAQLIFGAGSQRVPTLI